MLATFAVAALGFLAPALLAERAGTCSAVHTRARAVAPKLAARDPRSILQPEDIKQSRATPFSLQSRATPFYCILRAFLNMSAPEEIKIAQPLPGVEEAAVAWQLKSVVTDPKKFKALLQLLKVQFHGVEVEIEDIGEGQVVLSLDELLQEANQKALADYSQEAALRWGHSLSLTPDWSCQQARLMLCFNNLVDLGERISLLLAQRDFLEELYLEPSRSNLVKLYLRSAPSKSAALTTSARSMPSSSSIVSKSSMSKKLRREPRVYEIAVGFLIGIILAAFAPVGLAK